LSLAFELLGTTNAEDWPGYPIDFFSAESGKILVFFGLERLDRGDWR
jgi:hypothetical protein